MDKFDVAKRIKSLREAKKLTQNALANSAGVSPTYIYQLEKGEKSPTIEYLDHICWGLGISIEEFFSTKGNSEKRTSDKLSSLTAEQKELLNAFLNSL
ncbi:MAG: helix-turn-helix transcriptional regulator [Clostridiales bacterium]|nr:helix-turn-helix transcriptional regulator [Clostridiales bacterium]